ncbi:magnesium-translocating P-type ATPase, partial [Candidatus Sumerlaeota bacterium]|nr:magnesium-translocating P-type ATPase [Candidatus Sumerlaeota bacterium]
MASTLLPKSLLHALKHEDVRGGIPGELALSASEEAQTAIQKLGSRPEGLTEAEASLRLRELGPNAILAEQKHVRLKSLIRAFLNPLALLLLTLAAISFLTGDRRAGFMMSSMVLMGVILRFVQEARADQAAARLKAMIQVTATVLRGGRPREEPLGRVAPGDIVVLAAGDMIPADLRLVSSKDLFIAQATLTGESFPVEKSEKKLDAPPETTLDAHNLCFLGTSVASGTGTGIVVATGLKTYLGGMASAISDQGSETSFDRGLRHFTWLMMAYMGVMIPLVFILNGVTKHDWLEAFSFSVAVDVGLTPEMLPMIVSVCLSKGAMMMSEKKVIVKRLNAIQNFGAMDILCTDKTGTL